MPRFGRWLARQRVDVSAGVVAPPRRCPADFAGGHEKVRAIGAGGMVPAGVLGAGVGSVAGVLHLSLLLPGVVGE